jgi:hypothetical protein
MDPGFKIQDLDKTYSGSQGTKGTGCRIWILFRNTDKKAQNKVLLSPSHLRCFLFTPQNFPLGPNSGRQGRISFH